jgi:hypothetical protein
MAGCDKIKRWRDFVTHAFVSKTIFNFSVKLMYIIIFAKTNHILMVELSKIKFQITAGSGFNP